MRQRRALLSHDAASGTSRWRRRRFPSARAWAIALPVGSPDAPDDFQAGWGADLQPHTKRGIRWIIGRGRPVDVTVDVSLVRG